MINLFNPERIVIGGWAGTALCADLLPRIRERLIQRGNVQPEHHLDLPPPEPPEQTIK